MRNNLIQERQRRGLTGSELARRAGIPQPTYSKIERGDLPAYPKWRAQLVAALREYDGCETVFDTSALFYNEP